MKNKTTLTIVIILIAVIGIIIGNGIYQKNHNFDYYHQSVVKKITKVFNHDEKIQEATVNFVVYDTASITRLFFADKSGNQVLLQRDGTGWTVNDEYVANQILVDQMLYTLNRLHIKPVSVKKTDNIVTQMASTNTKVEVYQMMPRINLFNIVKLFYHETLSKVYYVGGVTQDNVGTYVLNEGDDKVYIAYIPSLNGSISSRFSANLIDWRDHHIFAEPMDNIQSVKLEINGDIHNSFIINTIGRAQYDMQRLDGENVEYSDNKVLTLLMEFKDVRFEAFLNDVDPVRRDSIINSPFQQRLTLTTKDGTVRSVTTFSLLPNADMFDYDPEAVNDPDIFDDLTDPDHQYALLSEGNEFVLIQDFVFGKLLRPADYYSKDYREDIPQIYYQELKTVESN